MCKDLGDDPRGHPMNVESLPRRGLPLLWKPGVYGVNVGLPGNLVFHNNLATGNSHLLRNVSQQTHDGPCLDCIDRQLLGEICK